MGSKFDFSVAIVGGGVTGAAMLYVLSRYTNLDALALFEKSAALAAVNSHPSHNSQTLHMGEIETNYSLAKAQKVKAAADLVAAYVERRDGALYRPTPKMVLGVGSAEVAILERRYEEFKTLFPELQKIGPKEIARLEPKVMAGRRSDEPVLALVNPRGHTINYQKLAESFAAEAVNTKKKIVIRLAEKVTRVERASEGFRITTARGQFRAKVVIVAAGPHSLIFAQALGYARGYGLLPVAGSFYCATKVLNGKVYTLQLPKLPFAAIHGDPDVTDPNETRFGPTAKVLPLLERHNYATVPEFIKTSVLSVRGVTALIKILSDPVIFKFVVKNFLFDLPFVGKRLFLKDARKIVPLLKLTDLRFGRGIGGIRPQLVNTKTGKLEMGDAKFVGENIIFTVTPSPGASVCLGNALEDIATLCQFFNNQCQFDKARFLADHRRS